MNMENKTEEKNSGKKVFNFKFKKIPVLLKKPKKNKQQMQQDPSGKLVTDQSSYRITEAYKTARTNILFALKKKEGCNIIALTSAITGEGKTTTTLNLAITFAMTNAKVLVIDADLRKPRVHKYAELDNENGLANYLGGFCELESCISTSERWGLDCITSGSVPPNPAELLSSPLLEEGLKKLSEKYDFIFIDTPPVNVVTDGIIVSKLVDGVMLVARQKYTAHEALKKAFASLSFAEATVVGVLLNDAEEQGNKYGYKYKYRRRYGYGKYYNYRYYRYYNYSSVHYKDKEYSDSKQGNTKKSNKKAKK